MWLDRSVLNRQGLRVAEALFEMLVGMNGYIMNGSIQSASSHHDLPY